MVINASVDHPSATVNEVPNFYFFILLVDYIFKKCVRAEVNILGYILTPSSTIPNGSTLVAVFQMDVKLPTFFLNVKNLAKGAHKKNIRFRHYVEQQHQMVG